MQENEEKRAETFKTYHGEAGIYSIEHLEDSHLDRVAQLAAGRSFECEFDSYMFQAKKLLQQTVRLNGSRILDGTLALLPANDMEVVFQTLNNQIELR